jgi:uncharacterized membrane protein
MRIASTLAEILGLVMVVACAALFDLRWGGIVLGVVLVLVGLAADPPRRSE